MWQKSAPFLSRFNTSTLLCDCELDWLVPWLRERNLDEFQFMKLECLHPEKFRGTNLQDIEPESLTCGVKNTAVLGNFAFRHYFS